ncbi:sensor domain-containing diguanylate cyclase [Vibrio hepatarius]|uniref:sensor domain-containing diguanylate cyclase n=1 Tax=Vibrio hepatarius TaxID=171383 RepID=UPI00142DCB4E|nr:sensor domain-containing diguanylate cyclase [Vibrio hepatarius]NIY82613.1 PAS domain-containing protein [Vibrio hepatarius]
MSYLNKGYRWGSYISNLILEGSSIGTWVWNVQTGETIFNEAWADIIGYSLDELTPISIDTWLKYVHPDDLKNSEFKLNQHFSGETEQYVCEARMRHKQGHWVKVLDKGKVLIRDDNNKPLWMFGVHVDVTDLWNKEKQITELKTQLELLTDNLPGFVYQYVLREDGTFYFPFATKKVAEIYGCSAEQVLQDANFAMEAVHPDDLERIQTSIEESKEQMSEWHQTFRVIHPLKGEIWLEGKSTPQRLVNGDTIWHGYLHDVTEERNQNEQIRLLSAAVSATTQGILITDAQIRIIDVNPAFEVLTGYSKQEIIGEMPSKLSSGKHSKDFYLELWKTLSEQEHWRGRIWNRKKTGEAFPVLVTIDVLKNQCGEVTNYICVFSDISEMIAEQELLADLVNKDPLTGLYNRRALDTLLERKSRKGRDGDDFFTIIYFDLDNFKVLNDSLGHASGDKMLTDIADKLSKEMREKDMLARVGGDEFVAVIESVNSEGLADRIVQRFEDNINEIAKSFDTLEPVSVSIGAAFFPLDGTDPEELLLLADARMYESKNAKKLTSNIRLSGT